MVVAPGRNFSSDSFLELTSLSTFWPEPGRNVLGQTQSFANGALGKQARNGDSWRSVRGELDGEFIEDKAGLERLLKGCAAELLMCILAPVRIFPGDCFLGVTTNSVCGTVPVRSVLDHLRIRTEIRNFAGVPFDRDFSLPTPEAVRHFEFHGPRRSQRSSFFQSYNWSTWRIVAHR